jgi:hypothetical protein
MSPPTPDLAGFADAQERLRGEFGEEVAFLFPAEVTWPADTAIDPESGEPYDPAVRAASSAVASAAVDCTIAFKAINRAGVSGNETNSPIGVVPSTHIMAICGSAAASAASGAIHMDVRGERFHVTSQKFDGVGGLQRFLSYGRLE